MRTHASVGRSTPIHPAGGAGNCRENASSCSGFTLVELLVVIAIIAILVAISFSVFGRMRTAADKVNATQSLAQLQLANISWATDNGGIYAPVWGFDGDAKLNSAWHVNRAFLECLIGSNPVRKSDGSIVISPNLLDPIAVRARKKGYEGYQGSFGYNGTGFEGNNVWGSPNSTVSFRVTQVVSPERSAAFITATDWIAKYGGRYLWQGAAAVEGASGNGKIALRHNGKALVAYYDGHVGEVTVEDFKRFDQNGGAKHIFWNADGF
jgi:prepilin-type N-terminal cleavage/methylation domain-containing protein/prepilin-type processing-associated H-X9-DG protein